MSELLRAEVYRSGADVSRVHINPEVKAGDDGADAETPAGVFKQTWLSDVQTCWQLKAGNAGQSSRLRGEVTKPRVAATLKSGGRYVVVASRLVDGGKGSDARKKVLIAEARKARLPTLRIQIMTCDGLTSWINEHPALAAGLRGIPPGYCSLADWEAYPVFRDPWVSSAAIDAKLDRVRRIVDFDSAKPEVHLHVYGRPGIGKTRFVLEACRTAPWSRSVLYVPQWAGTDVTGTLAAAATTGAGRLVLVVDQVPPDHVRALAFHAFAARDRLRVISIGHCESPDDQAIAQIEVQALDETTIAKLIEAAHPTMPPEYVHYLVSLSDGYAALARLAANAIATQSRKHTADLLIHGGIKQLMDSMLGKDSREPLHVLAVLSSVGWSGARAVEGEAIAQHFKLDWVDVQARVERFHDQFGIAPRANDLRYISPAPLGVYLALNAVQSYPDLVRSLFDKLPSEQARRAYNERLVSILGDPRAKEFGEEELARLSHWSHFVDPNAVDRWMALSSANPELAARNAREALQCATDEQRRTIGGSAQRGMVRGLVRLAAHRNAFHDAALALAELAAAENETLASNATAGFVGCYRMFLSGTASPYLERLGVIEELLASGRPALLSLAVRALTRVGSPYESAMVDVSPGPGPPPPQWQPSTHGERFDCVLAAVACLEDAASLNVPEKELVEAAERLAMLLRQELVREQIAAFMRAAIEHHPSVREQIRRKVHDVATNSRRFWKDRDEADIVWIESLALEFSDRTLGGRMREAIVHPDWDNLANSLEPIAKDLVADRAVLWSQWQWLTGGDAIGAWELGMALETADSTRALLPQMTSASDTGNDVRVIAGYIRSRATKMPAGWIDDWLDALEFDPSIPRFLIFDLTRRLADTSRSAQRIVRMARANQLPPNAVANLAFGPWVLGPELPALRVLFDLLLEIPDNHIHLLHMLNNRLREQPQDATALEDLALAIVTQPSLLLADSMSQHHWDKLAAALLPRHARMVARTIFAAQARPDGVSFFLEHSTAANTLDACVNASPGDVWEELAPVLTDDRRAKRFSIGFPGHVLERMPRRAVLDWIAADPDSRAVTSARMTAKNFGDNSLAAAILNRWGNVSQVKQWFFSAFTSEGWSGDASAHWLALASQLEGVAEATKIAGVRRWARDSALELRRMAEQDRKREAEARVRRFR
jgi:hypothetical protein